MHNPAGSSERITIQANGVYRISFVIGYSGATGQNTSTTVRKNGVDNFTFNTNTGELILSLVINDYISLQTTQTSGSSDTIYGNASQFSVSRIG
jgi:hypothetical protein